VRRKSPVQRHAVARSYLRTIPDQQLLRCGYMVRRVFAQRRKWEKKYAPRRNHRERSPGQPHARHESLRR
jgi:hypothetical protein